MSDSPDHGGGLLRTLVNSAAGWLRRYPKLAHLVDTVAELLVKQSNYRLSLTAAGTSFWLVLASFPAAIAAVTLYGLIADQSKVEAALKRLEADTPANVQALLTQQVQQAAQVDSGPLTIGLIVSLLLTLWSASTGAYALLRAIRLAYGLPPQGYVKARLRGITFTLVGLIVLFALGFVAALFNRALLELLRSLGWVGTGIASAILIAVLALGILTTIRVAIGRRTPLRSMIIGTVLATTSTTLFVIFVVTIGSAVANYQAVYGTVSTVAASLLAGYAVIYALLLSVLFNALAAPLPFTGHTSDAIEHQLMDKLKTTPTHSLNVGEISPSDQSGG